MSGKTRYPDCHGDCGDNGIYCCDGGWDNSVPATGKDTTAKGTGDARAKVRAYVLANAPADVLAALDAMEEKMLRYQTLLQRLNSWDALNPPVVAPYGDAPYWKAEIERVLRDE